MEDLQSLKIFSLPPSFSRSYELRHGTFNRVNNAFGSHLTVDLPVVFMKLKIGNKFRADELDSGKIKK